ncbi:HMG box-containing protein [Ceraceosorus bombacis]|uniref:HMG box-containing protein n=1 Tax=Ceraceosorus bombacis TaxID=401625 RepID=A0A0P1BF18_9BASI|nr:HMG box-containing protein [Ceraceosorus bombacis]
MLFVGARLLPRAVARSSATSLVSQVRNLSLSAARRTVATPVLSQAAAKSSSTATKSRKSATANTKKNTATKKDEGAKASGTKKNNKKTASVSADKKKKEEDRPWIKQDANGKNVPLPYTLRPKKPSVFVMFAAARFPILRAKPEYSLTKKDGTRGVDAQKISGAVGEEWKAMSEADKQQWNDKFESALAQYEADYKKWKSSLTREDIERQNAFNRHRRTLKTRPKRIINLVDPLKPKKPPIPFWLYLNREEGEQKPAGMRQAEWVREQSRAYQALSEAEKGPYEEQFAKNKEQYNRALKEYNEGTSA